MTKLYYTDPYLRDFTAEILEVIEKEGTYHIVLDQTAFYPEGGGQPSDTGQIENCPIDYVYEEEDIVFHVSSKKPSRIHKVPCHIDWTRRFDHMQHHLAQHLLSACLLEAYHTKTLSFHLGKDTCTLDLDKQLTKEELDTVFTQANRFIRERLAVTTLYPTAKELKKLKLHHTVPKTNGPIRLVQIEDLDISLCCGTHPNNTTDIMMIRLIKVDKHKGGLRVYFIAGHRAIDLLLNKEETALSTLEELTQKAHSYQTENTKLKSIVSDYEIKALIDNAPHHKGVILIRHIYENISPKELLQLGNKFSTYPHVVALLGLKAVGTCHLVFACSDDLKHLHMSKLLQDSITLVDGRGGGTQTSAQGGGKSTSNLESALDYATMKIKKNLGD